MLHNLQVTRADSVSILSPLAIYVFEYFISRPHGSIVDANKSKFEGLLAPDIVPAVGNKQRLSLIAACITVKVPLEVRRAKGHGPTVGYTTTPKAFPLKQGQNTHVRQTGDSRHIQHHQ